MAKTLTRWRPSMLVPFDFGDLLHVFAREIRVEEFIEDDRYTMRAEGDLVGALGPIAGQAVTRWLRATASTWPTPRACRSRRRPRSPL